MRKGVEENQNHKLYVKYQVIRIRRAKLEKNIMHLKKSELADIRFNQTLVQEYTRDRNTLELH